MTDTRTEEKPTILIVDDSPINIETLNGILSDAYQTCFATNGQDAFDLAKKVVPDIVLLDVIMPGLNGYETCSLLKEDSVTKDIPVIFVTSLDSHEDEELGLSRGAVDYITKPFSAAIVLLRVRTHIELKRKNDQLMTLAQIDPLTDIYNRRAIDQALDREWHVQKREGKPISLLMMDVDHFKLYNDHYGHGSGDDCLRSLAKMFVSSVTRASDWVGRYGGEEFVILLPGTDAEGATCIADKIVTDVRRLAIPHAQSPTASCVTVSIGVATTVAYTEANWNVVYERADQALYQAKQSGRNRFMLANS